MAFHESPSKFYLRKRFSQPRPHFFDLLKAVYLHLYVQVERTKVHVERRYTCTVLVHVYHRVPHLRPFAIIESRSVVAMIRSTVDDIIDL